MADNASLDFVGTLRLGFGVVDTRALINSDTLPGDITSLALIANLPQVILSVVYFSYNSLFTTMLMGYEWTSYAQKRKGLRVSHRPVGSQRSTYFLQLPYRFSIPLVVMSGTLHWLVSQSIFLVVIDVEGGQTADYSRTKTCGYSPIAMLVGIIVGTLMMITIIGFGFIPYKRGIPFVGSSSMAISAACHPKRAEKYGDTPMSEQKLQWGIVETREDDVRHGAFSTEDVQPLIKGRMYL
jgi:hypothetical protein